MHSQMPRDRFTFYFLRTPLLTTSIKKRKAVRGNLLWHYIKTDRINIKMCQFIKWEKWFNAMNFTSLVPSTVLIYTSLSKHAVKIDVILHQL